MMTRLRQRHRRQPLHLRHIQPVMNHRPVAHRPTNRHPHPTRHLIKSRQQHRTSPPSPPFQPRPPQHRRSRTGRRLHQNHLKATRRILRKQPSRPQHRRKTHRSNPPNRITINQQALSHLAQQLCPHHTRLDHRIKHPSDSPISGAASRDSSDGAHLVACTASRVWRPFCGYLRLEGWE